jgi:hypothetical protein
MAPAYPMLLATGAVWGERWVASLDSHWPAYRRQGQVGWLSYILVLRRACLQSDRFNLQSTKGQYSRRALLTDTVVVAAATERARISDALAANLFAGEIDLSNLGVANIPEIYPGKLVG